MKQNLRYFLRLAFTYVTRFKGLLFVGIILGISSFFAIRFLGPLFLNKTEVIGITGQYHSDDLPSEILSKLSDGLTKINQAGTPEPALAESWETPDKGKTWIFHLKDNLYWQDEEKLTSQDINYQFSDVEIEKPDEKTIIFKLQDPFVPFPGVVSKPAFKMGLLGTGEWKVQKMTVAGGHVQKLTLIKIDKGEEKTKAKGKIIYKFYPTLDRTKLAYKLGEVDKIVNILDPTPFDSWKTATITKEVDKNQVVTLFFNNQDDFLADKSLRQALIYAIDKESLGVRAISPISPNSWAYNPQVKKYSHDVQRAKEILEEMPNDNFKNQEIKLVSSPALLSVAERIAKDWQGAGVKTIVQVTSIIPSEFHAFLTIYDIPQDPDQYSIWHSTQESRNVSKYSSPRIDKLLEDGRVLLNFEERRKVYLDFQRFLLEDAPASFLYHPTYYTISRKS